MSDPRETGLCRECSGDLTLDADETSWQCEAEACGLRGQPQVAVSDEDRETMRSVGSVDDMMRSYFGPPAAGPRQDAPPADFESVEDVYRTFFATEPETDPERKRRWPFGRRDR